MFHAETEEDLHMTRTENAGVQTAKYVIQEMSLAEAMRDALETYRKRTMDRKSEDAFSGVSASVIVKVQKSKLRI